MKSNKECLPLLMSALVLTCSTAFAGPSDAAGTIKSVKGVVLVERGTTALTATPGMQVQVADRLKTQADSAVGLTLNDNTVISAGPNSLLVLDKFKYDNKTQKGELEATLKRGSLSAVSGSLAKTSPQSVQFKTSTMTLGVRGTDFVIEAADRGEE